MRDLSEWIEFFTAAGVPPAVRRTYAKIFVDHRITDSVVADLEKEHLKDMGINVIGDIIAILKQCKKVGHEDPSAHIPNVSSTTKMNIKPVEPKPIHPTPSTVQYSTPSSTTGSLVHRRMPPGTEGKYIVKLPAGTTAKTRRILTAMKQRSATTRTPIKDIESVRERKEKPTTPVSLASFEESDVEDSDGYRVILSKIEPESSTLSGSVFNRLGAPTSQPVAEPLSRTPNQTTVVKRLIARSINVPHSTTKSPSPVGDTRLSNRTPNSGVSLSSSTVTRRLVQPSITQTQSMKARLPMKRQITDSVFNRLNDLPKVSSTLSDFPHRSLKPEDTLGYAGVLKRPREHQPTKAITQPNPTRAKSIPFTEGVLSSSLTAKKLHSQPSVKNRLGPRHSDVGQIGVLKCSGSSVHSRLG